MKALIVVLVVGGCAAENPDYIADHDLATTAVVDMDSAPDLRRAPDLAWTDLAGGVDIAEAPRDMAEPKPDLAWTDLARADLYDPCNLCDSSYQKCTNGACVNCGYQGGPCCDDGCRNPDTRCIMAKFDDGGTSQPTCNYACSGGDPSCCSSTPTPGIGQNATCIYAGRDCAGTTICAP